MEEEIIQIIKIDLLEKMDILTFDFSNEFSLHFGVCQYIRNTYLRHKPETTKLLNSYFHTKNEDDLSYEILMKILRDLKLI